MSSPGPVLTPPAAATPALVGPKVFGILSIVLGGLVAIWTPLTGAWLKLGVSNRASLEGLGRAYASLFVYLPYPVLLVWTFNRRRVREAMSR
jgi:hypothetical protein